MQREPVDVVAKVCIVVLAEVGLIKRGAIGKDMIYLTLSAASLSRFQKLGSLGSLRSFSNGSCIFSGQSTNFVATIASVGKIFLMILAVVGCVSFE